MSSSSSKGLFRAFVAVWLLLLTGLVAVDVGLRAFGPLRPAPPVVVQAPPPAPEPIRAPIPSGNLAEAEESSIQVFETTAPSVVFITTLSLRQDWLRRNVTAIPQGTGSGFIWDREGHIVTNYHVVQGSDAAQVTLSDQSVWNARLVGHYADKDLAVLKIDAPAEKLAPLAVGTSHDLRVGQHVFAIGNPFGLDHTLSTGVVSGLGREIPSLGGRPIQGAIQTDAAINPGNSGGPLLDSSGRLIGVNTQIRSPSGASAGIGFAVPVDTITEVVPQLVRDGRVTRPALGVNIDEGNLAARFGLSGGLVILGVQPGSGAAESGLTALRRDDRQRRYILGDVIIGIDGTTVRSPIDLYRTLDERSVGDTVQVKLLRNTVELEVPVRLIGVQTN